MFQIETSNLPTDEKRRLHPEFLANEQAYLRLRDGLLATCRGQWVALADGKVVAAGPRLIEVMDRAAEVARHPYIALVGAEDEAVFRAVFATSPLATVFDGPATMTLRLAVVPPNMLSCRKSRCAE